MIHCAESNLTLQYPIKTKSSQLTQRSIILRDMNAIEDASSLNLNPEFLKSKQPGTAIISPQMKSIIIKCKDGESLLNVTRLQSVGRKEMGAADWIIGYRQARIDDQKDFIQFECAPSAKSEV
jgi:methionyl-tRNA formyltransferase